MDFNKRKLLVNAFFSLQFHYCPLIWMCHNTYNNKINRLHERCLRLIYSNKYSSFEELKKTREKKGGSKKLGKTTLKKPSLIRVKVHTKTSPGIMQEVFPIKDQGHYFLRNKRDFVIMAFHYGLESINKIR